MTVRSRPAGVFGFALLSLLMSGTIYGQDEAPRIVQCGGEITCHIFGDDTEGFRHPVHGEVRRDALRRAICKWEAVLQLSRPIDINVYFKKIDRLTNARGGPSAFWYSSTIHPWMYYPSPHATQMSTPDEITVPTYSPGSEFEANSGVHGSIYFDLDKANFDHTSSPYFYYGEDLEPYLGSMLCDFQAVALHEIGHVLGIVSNINSDGSYRLASWSVYDQQLYYPWGTPDAFSNLAHWLDGVRAAAVNSQDSLFWNGTQGNFLLLNEWPASIPLGSLFNLLALSADGSASHLHVGTRLIMDPINDRGVNIRHLDVTPGMLADLGYSTLLHPILQVLPPLRLPWNAKSQKDTYDSQVVVGIENWGPRELEIESVLVNPGEETLFELETDSMATIRPWEKENVVIGFNAPTGYQRIFIGQLGVTSNDPASEYKLVSFATYKEMADADQDGLADDAETFDFDEGVGFYNPFDPEELDSTGDNGATTADGILDGFNDFDNDGPPNMAEFDLGYDPLDPGDYPVMDDTDGDGLSDYEELRDLDFSTEGIQNPLDPWRSDGDEDGILDGEEDYDGDGLPNAVELAHPTIFDVLQEDVTGDDGALAPDTILDGENDFDNDGISNEDEVRYGLDIVVYTAIGDIEWQLCVDE